MQSFMNMFIILWEYGYIWYDIKETKGNFNWNQRKYKGLKFDIFCGTAIYVNLQYKYAVL